MKNILIFGASGHSKMIVDIILKTKSYNLTGFLDSNIQIGNTIYGYNILGDISNLNDIIDKYNIYGIVIGIGDNYTRKIISEEVRKQAPKIKFINIIHPSAVIAEDITISEGAVIMAGAIVNAGAKIGRFCILNTKSSLGHESTMADFSSLASGATVGGNVNIGNCSAICLSASIINNINVGNHTVIGSGALVIKSIGDFKQAIGVPINVIKDRSIDSKYLTH